MSFAAPKKSSRKTSPDSFRKGGNSFLENNLASIHQRSAHYNIDPDYLNRIDTLENELSKISKQQDALLPLMNMLEVTPTLAKNETLLKGINRRSQETEDRISRLEQLMKNYHQNIEQTVSRINTTAPKVTPIDTSFIENSLRDVSSQVNRQGNSIKELESTFGNLQKSVETKVTETISNSTRTMEIKLERQRTDFNTALSDLSKNVDLTFKV